jgi:hypothetical protein
MNKKSIVLKYRWKTINHEDFKNFNEEPAVYRWKFYMNNKLKVYIGETINLKNRIKGYKNPGPIQKTNLRIKKEFLDKSDKVVLQKLIIEGSSLKKLSLKNIYYRRLIENFLLIHSKDKLANLGPK